MNMSTKTIKISIDDLIDKFKKYNDNEEDIALIRRAYDYAEKGLEVYFTFLIETFWSKENIW